MKEDKESIVQRTLRQEKNQFFWILQNRIQMNGEWQYLEMSLFSIPLDIRISNYWVPPKLASLQISQTV